MTARMMTAAVAVTLFAGLATAQEAPVLTTPKEKLSYALGVDVGSAFREEALDLDAALLFRGLQDSLAGKKTLLSEEEIRTIVTNLQNELRQKQMAAMQKLADDNKKASEAYLAANGVKPGVVTLPSGLQYRIVKPAEGAKPTAEDTVVCHYRGTLVDGTEFDSSYTRNEPMTIEVGRIIKGWTEALQLMPVGSKWELVIPPALAYGERGAGRAIGPNSTLIFEIELLSIKPRT
jgi:FKBP-type peptidyl-prolyl cis-trans isomerase FklB